MINRVTGILGSLYYVGQAEKANKVAEVSKEFKRYEVERIEKIQRINKLNALNEKNQEQTSNQFFKTEIVKDEQGTQSIVMTNNHASYRQIHLSGQENKQDINLVNPAKIKAAYFTDEV